MALPPQRRARSRSLPIAVAAGLAIGVFGGLLIVRGTGSAVAEENESAADESGDDNKGELRPITTPSDGDKDDGDKDVAAKDNKDDGDKDDGSSDPDDGSADTDGGSTETAAGGDAADAGAATVATAPDAGAGEVAKVVDPVAPAPVITDAKITFDVAPEPATQAEGYALLVDDVAVVGTELVVKLEDGKKRIRVTVSAPGYRKYSRRYTIKGDQLLKVRLKRPGKTTGGSGPGSLIDL
jgi:hypothetical protein